MKVERAHVENWKRLRIAEVKPSGELVIVGGRNGQGKTSLLDALESALGGRKLTTPMPVHDGADRAEIIIETDDPPLRIRQYYTADGNYGLTITDRNSNMQASRPSEWMAKFFTKLSFDPLAFTRMGAFEQGDALLRLVGLDFTQQDREYARMFETRTGLNRDVTLQRELAGRLPTFDPSLPETPVSLNDVVERQQQAVSQMNDRRRIEAQHETAKARVRTAEDALQRARVELAEAQKAEGEARAAVTSLPEPPALEALHREVAELEATNDAIRRNQEAKRSKQLLDEREAEVGALTEDLDGMKRRKREAIAGAHMPVPGLGVDDDGKVTYGDIPFEQAAASEKIRVSAAVALAMMPQLAVLLIRDASLLDDDAIAVLQELAEDAHAQIWLERVGTVGAQIVIEDGEATNGD